MKDGKRKPVVWPLALSSVVLGAGALIKILSNTVFRNRIIIEHGVRALSKVQFFGSCMVVVGVLLLIVALMPIIQAILRSRQVRRQETERQTAKARMLASYAEDSDNPELTRKWLEQMRQEMPDYRVVVDECLKQMDRMDDLQDKQEALINMNSAAYLRDTITVLLNVEKHICRNFRNIVNLCIAGNITFEHGFRSNVQIILENNEKKLNDANELLKASADWINHYNQDKTGDRSELENWIAVIRDSLKED